jgi:hypothetical protein
MPDEPAGGLGRARRLIFSALPWLLLASPSVPSMRLAVECGYPVGEQRCCRPVSAVFESLQGMEHQLAETVRLQDQAQRLGLGVSQSR